MVPFLNNGQDFLFPKAHISSFTSWDLEASSVLLWFILRKLIITAMYPEEDSRGIQETSVGPSEHWVNHACLMEPWLKDYDVVTITIPVTVMLPFSVSFIPSQSPHKRQHGQTSYSWHSLLPSCLLPPFMPKSSNCSCFPSSKRAPPRRCAPCSWMILMENESICGARNLSFSTMFLVVCVHASSFLFFHLAACLAEPHRHTDCPCSLLCSSYPTGPSAFLPAYSPHSLVIQSVRPFR